MVYIFYEGDPPATPVSGDAAFGGSGPARGGFCHVLSVLEKMTPRSLRRSALRGSALCLLAGLAVASCSAPSDQKMSNAGKQVAVEGSSQARLRLMSAEQYANTLHYIFGDDIKVPAAFAPLQRTDGLLASGASGAGVTAGQLQQLARAAPAVASQVIDTGNLEQHPPAHRDYLIPCKPADPKAADDACAREFLKTTGRLLFRRTLSDAKLAELVTKAHDGADRLKDFYAGIQGVLE